MQTQAKAPQSSAGSRMNLGRTPIDKVIAKRFGVRCLLDDAQDAYRMKLDERYREIGYTPSQRERLKQLLGLGGNDRFNGTSPSSDSGANR